MNLLDEKRKLIPTGQYRNAQAFWDNYISPTFVAPIKREIINPINREIVAPISSLLVFLIVWSTSINKTWTLQ